MLILHGLAIWQCINEALRLVGSCSNGAQAQDIPLVSVGIIYGH